MVRILFAISFMAIATFFAVPEAKAQDTVECHSQDFQYDECWAGALSQPQLIHQISNASCILNRSWGYNPRSGYIWVAQGCSGVFADVGGYHHGRGDTYDSDARHYDKHGHDAGAVVGGLVLGAILAAAVSDDKQHSTSNRPRNEHGYSGCHGSGCLVDNPDRTNFDRHGNYQGCHGMGCLVDDPND